MTLLTKGYEKINNILSVDFCEYAASTFMNGVIRKQPIMYDPDRGFCWQQYRPLDRMLEEVKPKIEKIVGEELFPTYSYITGYTNNSYMLPHKDRPSCEISVSINLASTSNWALNFTDLTGKDCQLTTKIGDGVVYLGTEVTHWRDLLVNSTPEFFIQTFLHYVRANGKYACYQNDVTSVHPLWDA